VHGQLAASTPRDDFPARPLAEVQPFVEQTLVELVEDARAHGAQVVFTESPTYGDPRPADVRALYKRVAERLGVPMVQLPDAELESFGPELFKDRGHLNRQGAQRFTAWIGPKLRDLFHNDKSRK
jgi:lysophospholipase L1-like esterase